MSLALPQADRHQTNGPRIGLALAGGGPLGIVYEIGALHALEEALEGLNFSRLDTYVGVSAGAVVAATLANRMNTGEICRLFIHGGGGVTPLNPEAFFVPAIKEYWQRSAMIPGLLLEAIGAYLKNPFDLGLLESLSRLSRAIPTGLFDNETIHDAVREHFCQPGRSNDFRELRQKLFVIAVDLDTGESVKFGAPGYDDIPISKAVQASTALPGLYSPVEIGGHYYVDGVLQKTVHASVALAEGVDLLFCVNPIVPFDANLSTMALPGDGKLAAGGLPVVLSQTFRSIIHSRLRVGMSKYDTLYENADVVLFEPSHDDARLFFTNVFSFSDRRRLCQHAYRTTRRDLLARRAQLEPVLARHGVRLRLDVLEDETRELCTSLPAADRLARQGVTRQLDELLDQLQSALTPLEKEHG